MSLQATTDSEGYWFPLPEGWIERPLGELFETQLGKMKGKNASLGEQFSYLKGRNLQWGDVQVDSLETMHFSSSERVQYELLAGDLLVCEYGEVGRCAIWEDSVPNCYFQNHIYRIRATGDVPVEYLRYFLEYATKMPGFSRFVTQTSVQQISQHNLRNIPIPYNPNSTSNTISSMQELDLYLGLIKQMMSKLYYIRWGLIDEFFSNQIVSVNQQIPFSDVAKLKRGYDLPTQEREKGDVPIFGSNGVVGFHNIPKIQPPGVITGRSGTIGKIHVSSRDYWPLNTSLYVVDFRGNNPNYVAILLEWMRIEQYAISTGVPSLDRKNVHSVMVPNVPAEQKTIIVESIREIDRLIEVEVEEKGKIKMMRSGILSSSICGDL